MQHFTSADHKYAYSPHHDPIGTVQPGETFTVDAVEGWSNFFRSPADFTPETYHAAEAVKWAVTGPIAVAGAEPGGVVAVTIHEVEVRTPGVCVYGPYADDDPLGVVGPRDRRRAVRVVGRQRPVRRAHDPAVAAAGRVPRGRAGRGRAARDAPGSLWRQPGLQGTRRGSHAGAALRACRRRPLLRGLQGADERRRDRRAARGGRAGDGHGRAAAPAGLAPLAAARDGRPHHDDRRRHAARVGRPAGVPRAARLGGRRLRHCRAKRPRC